MDDVSTSLSPAPSNLDEHYTPHESESIPDNHENLLVESRTEPDDTDSSLAGLLGLEAEDLTDTILIIAGLKAQIPETPETSGLHQNIKNYIDTQHANQESDESRDNEAIAILERGVVLLTDDDQMIDIALAMLGELHIRQFHRLGGRTNAERAVECLTKALSLAPEPNSDRPAMLNNLAVAYAGRHKYSKDPADIDEAISYSTQAVALADDGEPEKSSWLNNLGNWYQQRFDIFGNLHDINTAIEHHTKVVGTIELEATTSSLFFLENLANAYNRRFYFLSETEDLDKAINYQKQAMTHACNNKNGKARCLSNLGAKFHDLFRYNGKLVDIDSAIKYQSQAVILTPEEDYARSTRLNNLGVSHQARFDRLAELADIDKAIEFLSQAVFLTPEGHADKAMRLNNLGVSHHCRFERLEDLSDINIAIELQSQAMALSNNGNEERYIFMDNLALSYHARCERLNELLRIDKAIELQRSSVSNTPKGHANMPERLNNLGLSLTYRYSHLGNVADIDEAIEHQTQAVLITPDGLPLKVHCLNNLANSHARRQLHQRDASNLDLAIKYYGEAARSPTGSPTMKLKIAIIWANQAFIRYPHLSLDAYKLVMELIPQVIWLGETVSRRYELLNLMQDNIAGEAARVAISLHAYDLALEWIEDGRLIVWRQILQLHTPFDKLSRINPALASELKEVAQELESSSMAKNQSIHSTIYSPSMEKVAQYHRRLAEKWEVLLSQARCLPEIDNLLKPKWAKRLPLDSQYEAVVVVNLHDKRCDALALLPGSPDIIHILLPSFSYKSALTLKDQIISLMSGEGIRTRNNRRPVYPERTSVNDGLKSILSVLWHALVKPVLDRLGFLRAQKPPSDLPHLIWCTTGPLSFLPLHAAGCYDGLQEKVFDYIVSSYTPRLSTTLASSSHPGKISGILAVGQSAAIGGCDPLPGAATELDEIQKLAGDIPFRRLDEHQATFATVLDAMETHSWVHFACHASQDMIDPTASAFYLSGGKLSLATIMGKSFRHNGLAFLSACQTATGDPKLSDEAVHLAAGMVAAGYSTVIATLWSIKDEDAPLVAKTFYSCMLGGGPLKACRAARALHDAVNDLRGKVGESEFARWVPYIHIGG